MRIEHSTTQQINLRSYDMIGTLFWVNRQSHPIEHIAQPESARRMEEALFMTVDGFITMREDVYQRLANL